MKFKMSPLTWLTLALSIALLLFLIPDSLETSGTATSPNNRTISQGTPASSSHSHSLDTKTASRTRNTPPPFLDDPDDFSFTETEVSEKGDQALDLYQEWQNARIKRENLKARGLGSRHPNVVTLSDREVLLGNRINLLLRQ